MYRVYGVVSCFIHLAEAVARHSAVQLLTLALYYVCDSSYLSNARKAAGSTSGSSISVEVVAIPPLNIASKTALPTDRKSVV